MGSSAERIPDHRELESAASCIDALQQGDVEKLVITQAGKPVVVMVSVEQFDKPVAVSLLDE